MLASHFSATEDRILLVDDECDLTHLWRLILERTGRFKVQEENHGASALRTAREFRPDLIFLDHNLSGTNGGRIATELRADADLRQVPIVFVTGSMTPAEAAFHGVFGGTPTLAKPFDSTALPRVARAVLEHRRQTSIR